MLGCDVLRLMWLMLACLLLSVCYRCVLFVVVGFVDLFSLFWVLIECW